MNHYNPVYPMLGIFYTSPEQQSFMKDDELFSNLYARQSTALEICISQTNMTIDNRRMCLIYYNSNYQAARDLECFARIEYMDVLTNNNAINKYNLRLSIDINTLEKLNILGI